jgi:hypothetical protein
MVRGQTTDTAHFVVATPSRHNGASMTLRCRLFGHRQIEVAWHHTAKWSVGTFKCARCGVYWTRHLRIDGGYDGP